MMRDYRSGAVWLEMDFSIQKLEFMLYFWL